MMEMHIAKMKKLSYICGKKKVLAETDDAYKYGMVKIRELREGYLCA